jgi:hypothetical protein
LKGRQIIRQHNAVPIQNQAAARGNRLGSDTIALRQSRIIFMSHNLQIKDQMFLIRLWRDLTMGVGRYSK